MNQSLEFKTEFTVQTMIHDLHELIAKTNRLNINTTELEKIYRRLQVMNLISTRHVISVAGLQSAGKTLIVKRTLGLPDDLLLSEVGVGEKRPVLISSDSTASNIKYLVTRAAKTKSGSFEIQNDVITKELLNEGVQNPNEEMLWFEIVLPKNNVLGHLTLALLPGFERSSRTDSQKFLDIFLNSSTGVILVLNHMRLAQMNQERLLQKVADTYKDKSPGFVITHASELSPDKMEMIRHNLFEKFEMADEAQIILSDTDIKNVPQEMERLIKSNSQYTQESLSLHHEELLQLGESLSYELTSLEDQLEIKENYSLKSRRELRTIQRIFEAAREKYIKNLEDNLKTRLDSHVQKCVGEITESIKNEKYNNVDKIKSLFKSDLKFNERLKILELIRQTYAQEGTRTMDYIIVDSIEAMNRRNINMRRQHVSPIKPIKTSLPPKTMKFLETSNENRLSNQANNEVSASDGEIGQSNFTQALAVIDQYLNTDDLEVTLTEQDIQQLPVISGIIMQHLILTKGDVGSHKMLTEGIEQLKMFQGQPKDLEEFHQEFSNLFLDANRIATGAAVFFGIDALDGTLNGFAAINGLLGTLGISAALTSALSIAGLGSVAGLIAIQKGSAKIEKFKYERHEYSRKVLEATANYQREVIVEGANRIMDEMQDKLTYAYRLRRQDGSDLGLYEEVEVRLKRLEYQCGKLREEAFRNAGFLN
ncbi:hypothetical protein [Exiguobacterium aurantiacum]|uniref:hypothetical protein n=1 Tax=Exiguobacterium aurantiacum TaxID=33987 RepID=UPI000877869E|nr:hypothetical protein [Exiguobacterium aurantiacum]